MGDVRHFSCFEMIQPKVRNLQDPATVHEAVGRLQVAMAADFAVMEIDHAL